MINEISVEKFCCEDISKIENYDKAVADTTQTWHCHHRLELIATGAVVDSSAQDLKDWGIYYNRPADELIFLTKSEHHKLHSLHMSNEQKQKLSKSKLGIRNPMYGKHHSEEHTRKLKEAWERRRLTPVSEETRKKMSESAKRRKKL